MLDIRNKECLAFVLALDELVDFYDSMQAPLNPTLHITKRQYALLKKEAATNKMLKGAFAGGEYRGHRVNVTSD